MLIDFLELRQIGKYWVLLIISFQEKEQCKINQKSPSFFERNPLSDIIVGVNPKNNNLIKNTIRLLDVIYDIS
jgi:hypothetical protein